MDMDPTNIYNRLTPLPTLSLLMSLKMSS